MNNVDHLFVPLMYEIHIYCTKTWSKRNRVYKI